MLLLYYNIGVGIGKSLAAHGLATVKIEFAIHCKGRMTGVGYPKIGSQDTCLRYAIFTMYGGL